MSCCEHPGRDIKTMSTSNIGRGVEEGGVEDGLGGGRKTNSVSSTGKCIGRVLKEGLGHLPLQILDTDIFGLQVIFGSEYLSLELVIF